jgi:hypothetical protein
MPDRAGTLEALALEMAHVLAPLEQRLQSGRAMVLLGELGLRLPPGVAGQQQLADALKAGVTAAVAVKDAATELAGAVAADDLGKIVASGRKLVDALGTLVDAVGDVATLLPQSAQANGGLTQAQLDLVAQFVQGLPGRVLDLLTVEYLERRVPAVARALVLAGLIERVVEPGVPGDPLQPPFLRRTLRLDRLGELLASPAAHAEAVYGWGAQRFDGVELLRNLHRVLDESGYPAALVTPSGGPLTLDGGLFTLAPEPATSPPGLKLVLRVPSIVDFQQSFPFGQGWSIEVKTGGRFVIGVEGTITPPAQVALKPPGGTMDLALGLGLVGQRAATAPFVPVRLTGGTRLEATTVKVLFGFTAAWDTAAGRATAEPAVDAEIGGGRLVLDFGDGDGFLARVFPPDGMAVPFDLAAGWSGSRGLYFRGGAGFEVTLPLHKQLLGVLKVESIFVALGVRVADGQAVVATTLAATASVALGPFNASVERMGLEADVTFPPGGGNLGPAQLELGFKPPDGAGMVIDAAAVVGGGYLLFDRVREQYAGVLELEIKGGLSVKAIGLITTRMPDGSRGFSLLVIIAVEFPAIQLGFGFTLNGVGGLLGANRTMSVDALRAGVRNRVLDSILFPPDPVKNAAKVIADLSAVFPVAPGRFVFGLMAKLGWGTPTILGVELGIIVELPSPLRIALIGRLSLQLPTEDEALVRLKLDVLGVLDFDRSEASVDATLYDSLIAGFTVSGDMAARLNWGAAPTFAMSAGGFNPRFSPPPAFPSLDRMAIALATEENPRLRLEAYFAKTPATIQFGARLDVFAEADAGIFGYFTVSGYLQFDALIHPSPLCFVVDIAGGLTLRRNGQVLFGVDLRMSLSGPNPWRAWGEATFEFLGKRRIPFDVTMGVEALPPPLPPIDFLGDLLAALSEVRNWSAQLPPDGHGLVALRTLDPGDEVVVHPLGVLAVRQQAVPLRLDLTRYGGVDLATPLRFEVGQTGFGSTTPAQGGELRDPFPAAEFQQLSEDEKLSRPAFEPFASGRSGIGSAAVSHGTAVPQPDDEWDTVVVDQAERQPAPAPYQAHPVILAAQAGGAAAARSPLRTGGPDAYAAPPLGVRLHDPAYRLARADTLAAAAATHGSFAEAESARRAAADGVPWQVVGSHEGRP